MDPVFTKRNDEYTNYLNPNADYLRQTSVLMARMHNISVEEAFNLVKEAIKANKPRIPMVRYKQRNDFGDLEIDKVSLTQYLKDVKSDKDIIVPSFTVYAHPDKKKSIISVLLKDNVKDRSAFKKLMFKAEREGDKDKESFYNNAQSSKKVENNSASGAFGSNGTILYNPSAHFTLTSITRCVSGVGNAISESIVGGNKYFRTPEVVCNYVATILTYANKKLCKEVMDRFNLHYPTSQEVMNSIKRISRWYWKDKHKEDYILSMLDRITPLERACFLYINDLWNIKEYNNEFMRELLGSMSKKVTSGSEDPLSDLDDSIPGTNVLTHHIYASEIRGKDINYKELKENNDPLLIRLASTAKNIKEVLNKYRDFFKAFFVTEILPTNTAYIKDMMRFNIVLSDTDSTCCSYDKWVQWFFGGNRFDDAGIGLSAAVMTITTQVMDHTLKLFSKNMNCGKKEEFKLEMKNEFYWPVFVTSDATKHYFANTMIREGNVFDKLKLEKKGAHFIASTIGGDIVKKSEEMMLFVMNEVMNGRKVSVRNLCNQVADLEKQILHDFNNGKFYMFRTDTIKEEKAYRQEKEESKYINHILWMDVFSERFGIPSKPPYPIYTIALNINNKTQFKNMLDEIEKTDPDISKNLAIFCSKYKKDMIKTLRVPRVLADAYGLPKCIIPFIDIRTIIMQAMRPFEYVLKTVGYYKKPDFLLYELGYGTDKETDNGNES